MLVTLSPYPKAGGFCLEQLIAEKITCLVLSHVSMKAGTRSIISIDTILAL
jgi:hypothetical protein